jgi:ribonuclease J
MDYQKRDIFVLENGQEVIFSKTAARLGHKIDIKNIYVDEISGEEVENYLIRDREKLSREGIFIILAEINSSTGQLATPPELIMRGSSLKDMKEDITASLQKEIEKELIARPGKVMNWMHTRKLIGNIAERLVVKKFRSRPLVLPVVIEV